MRQFCYVPSLKSKRGERLALNDLEDVVKGKIKPILNIVQDNIDVTKFYDNSAFVDLHANILENATEQNIESTLKKLFQQSSNKTGFTSVIRHGYSKSLLKRIKPYLFDIEEGIALRIPRISLSELEHDIKMISEVLSIEPALFDIIIDFERINDIAIGLINEFSENIKNATKTIEYRNLIILSSAFPEGIRVPSNTIGEIIRYDWLLYLGLQQFIPNIIFGDYGSDDPMDPTINTRMNIVPTIRYTFTKAWKIVRGYYDPAAPFDFSQFADLSKQLVSNDFYQGKEFSWGDNRIYQCANGECGSGNLETCVRVAMNHHITFVSSECAHLP